MSEVATSPVSGPPSEPLIDPRKSFADVNREVSAPLERPPGLLWKAAFGITFTLVLLMTGVVSYQMKKGIGILGINHPVGWGVYITNFVFWIGIGHAGTLISAILHLFRQRWRTAINRSAEAMTIFAVMTAGPFPLIHLGRNWFAYLLVA